MDTRQWYESLNKPSWAPEPSLFGQVWSVLYVIIAGVHIWLLIQVSTDKLDWKIALPFWINLFLNLIFTPIQFGLKNNFLSMLVIVAVLLTIVWSMISIWPHNRTVALVFIPYLVWVAIATVLQSQIWWLNR